MRAPAHGSAGRLSTAASLAVVMMAFAGGQAIAEDHGGGGKKKKEEVEAPLPPEPDKTPAEQYCSSVQQAAAAAQIALQRKDLEKAKAALEERIKQLDERTAEIKTWLKRREDFLAQANEGLLAIYSKMSAEAAAQRLLNMNEMIAAALLSKLPPKTASGILAEMDSTKAAKISSLLAGAAEVLPEKKPAPKAETP